MSTERVLRKNASCIPSSSVALLVLGDFVWQSPFSQVFEVPHNSSILHESLNSALQHSCGLRLEKKKKEKAGNVHKSGYSDYVITINACTCMAKCWKGACSNLRWQNGSTCSQGKHLFNLLLLFFKQQTADKQPIPL